MASTNIKRAAAVATMATSMILFGGAAFASSSGAVSGDGETTGLSPVPISHVLQTVRNTAAEGDRQVRQLQQLR